MMFASQETSASVTDTAAGGDSRLARAEPILTVDHVSVSFSGRQILRDVTFGLATGEFCGLIGTNGSGKTTLMRFILGFQRADAGRVQIKGVTGRRLDAVGYVPQKIVLDVGMPLRARDVVALGLDGRQLGIPLPSKRRRELVDEMLVAVGAEEFADQRVGRLSGGEQQRVLVAHALVRRPHLLLLDEPLANLDVRSVAEIVDLLHRLSVAHGMTILLSSHDMNPLLPVMDRLVYLANGRCASGRAADVVRTNVLSELYGHHIDVIRVHGRVLVVAGPPGERHAKGEATSNEHVSIL
jgi:zinc/manganese transport system ATP-binding protein